MQLVLAEEVADGEVVKTATNTADGEAVFKDIEFTEAGSFAFTVVEVSGTEDDLDNVEYDTTVYDVTATVVDNFDGNPMTVTWSYGSLEQITFDNTYPTVVVKGTKFWKDDKYFEAADEDGDIPAENGYERPESVTINLYADGEKIDETTASEDTEWKWEFKDLPMYSGPLTGDERTPISYTVTETDEAGFESEISPENYDVSGEDITEFEYDVTNTPLEEEVLEPTDLIIKKTDELTGNVIGTGATFELTGGDLEEAVEYTTGTDGTVKVTFEKDGKYTLAETKAPEGYVEDDLPSYDITVKKDFIKVELNEDKNLWQWFYDLFFDDDTKALFDEDAQTLTVPNPPKTTDITVTKVWDDENNKIKIRPESVTFNLYRSTEIEEESDAGLSADLTAEGALEDDANIWTYVFEKVPAYRDGYEVTYTVKELDENGKPHYTDLIINNPDGLSYFFASYVYATNAASSFFPFLNDMSRTFFDFTDNQWQVYEDLRGLSDCAWNYPDYAVMTTDETAEYASIESDLSTYLDSKILEFITGSADVDVEWDSFVDTLYSMGLQDMIDLKQDAYDRAVERVNDLTA